MARCTSIWVAGCVTRWPRSSGGSAHGAGTARGNRSGRCGRKQRESRSRRCSAALPEWPPSKAVQAKMNPAKHDPRPFRKSDPAAVVAACAGSRADGSAPSQHTPGEDRDRSCPTKPRRCSEWRSDFRSRNSPTPTHPWDRPRSPTCHRSERAIDWDVARTPSGPCRRRQ